MFIIVHEPTRKYCAIQWASSRETLDVLAVAQRRQYVRLNPSVGILNIWLATLAADSGYRFSTLYEYAKVAVYALTWLAQEPVQIGTQRRVTPSLVALGRMDMRTLFAWLDIPAVDTEARAALCKTGMLPVGYHVRTLSAATRNVRLAALTAFYDWVVTEYEPDDEAVLLPSHPLKRDEHPLSHEQVASLPEGLLPKTLMMVHRPSPLLRRRPPPSSPRALSPTELHWVFDAIPSVSHGRNAANRNGACIRLLLWGMLRASEVTQLVWETVEGQTIAVVGKGGKSRAVPIADSETWTYLSAYTNELRLPLSERFHGPLLRQLDHETRGFTIHSIEHLMLSLKAYFHEQAATTLQLERRRKLEHLAQLLHSHLFRATGATYFAAAGMNLIKLSFLLGHASPETTQRYYLAAEQMHLPEEVQRICSVVMHTLEYAETPVSQSALGWYERRGIFTSGEHDGDSSH